MEITHQMQDGHLVQIVSPERLREILDAQGEDYTKPDDFRPGDEWVIG